MNRSFGLGVLGSRRRNLFGGSDRLKAIGRGYVLSWLLIGMTVAYIAWQGDPYIVLGITPFLLLGSARGKHPVVLLALASIPSLFLLLISFLKSQTMGFPLTVLDRFLLQENIVMLAYNDYRVATGIAVLAILALIYVLVLRAGKGRFSRFEKAAAAISMAASAGCVVVLLTTNLDFLMDGDNNQPTFRTFIRSALVPEARLNVYEGPDEPPANLSFALTPPTGRRPDLVFILEESTFHPQVLDPQYKPRALFTKRVPTSGPLRVHTVDGGTWRSEFALATQVRPNEFGGSGWYVFHQLAGRLDKSVFTKLKDLGYRTIVIAPVPGEFINSRQFYESIGVTEYHDPKSLGISDGWDWKVNDERFYREIERLLDADPSRPSVILMMTIHQHGPHDPVDPISDYLKRFDASDRAYEAFLDNLQKRHRPVGVVAFGDHQPLFMGSVLKDDSKRFTTFYEIRCVNFACDKPADRRDRELDITLLTPTALEHFGFELDEFSRYQQSLFAECTENITKCSEAARLKLNKAYSVAFH